MWQFKLNDVTIQGGPKSKPLPNAQKIVLNHIKTCQFDYIYFLNQSMNQAL